MKLFVNSLALGAGLLLSTYALAQTPMAAPAAKAAASASAPAATKGVTVANPMASATTATATPPAKSAKGADNTPAAAAAGGGVGKVWVNTGSKVYHCIGTKYYGKTKAGEYMSEADAKAKGNHGVNNKACS